MSQTGSRTLTPREAEVLELVSHGLTNSEAAAHLDVSVHAVKYHLASIYRKLGVANRTEAAGLYLQHLVTLPHTGADHQRRDGARGRSADERARRCATLSDPPVLELPPRSRAPIGTGDVDREEQPLGYELSNAVRRSPAGIEAVTLAAVAALLHRYTHAPEIAVEHNGSAVWLDVSGNPTFAELLSRIECELAEAPSDGNPTRGDGLQLAVGPGAGGRHSLALSVEELEELVAIARFDRSIVDRDTARQLLRHLVTLLAAGLQSPSRKVATLALLTPGELESAIHDWNNTDRPFPDCRADELVAVWARERPEAVAAVFGGVELSYGALDARANALAHYLQGLGVGPEVLVAICLERSLDMLVGLLGIMRAGGAYVPVDPAFPRDRQQFMLADAEVGVVVTQERLLEQLPAVGITAVCLDRDAVAIATAGSSPPACAATPESLAYVIYTSGSTGKPKGVQISHRALVNFLTTMAERPGLNADDVLVAVTTLSFDIAGLELYLPLVTGSRVVIAPQQVAADPRQLATLIADSGATVVQATPTTWRMLLDSGWPGQPGLRALCGGEALPTVLAEQLLERELELWNMYGPTETTIWSSIAPVSPGQPLTIGRPIANTELYVLDDAMQLAPPGVPGELHIGGAGLARGYLKRPELTAEKFVIHPFNATPGARLYKTGDLSRYRNDGTIEFLGRRDHQVKFHGYRIELGEIETALARQPGVRAAVAVIREDEPGDVRLVAYVVAAPDAHLSSAELRRALGDGLPSYMVPSAIVVLDSLPLTPNGKVNRKVLPEPRQDRATETALVPPRTPLEERLVKIWRRELGVAQIGVTDDFFELGVTSIVAARLFARIEHEVGTTLPLGALFHAPTIESLARLIENGAEDAGWTSLVPIQRNGTKAPIFCVHGGAGTILHLQPLARRLGPDQPFYGLQARGLYGGAAPLHTVEEMSTHYLSELRSLQPEGPYLLAGYCFGSIVAFEMAQTLVREGERVDLLAVFNGPSPVWIHGYWERRRARTPPRWRRGAARTRRLLTDPRRIVQHIQRKYIWPVRIRHSLSHGLPIPEEIRELYFLMLNARAEVAYAPRRYSGPMVIFYGNGLYPTDPTLGWNGLAEPIEIYAVPGEHTNNREIMAEPHVAYVADRLQEVLANTPSGEAHATIG